MPETEVTKLADIMIDVIADEMKLIEPPERRLHFANVVLQLVQSSRKFYQIAAEKNDAFGGLNPQKLDGR